jgi:hypothetical protein
MARRPAEAPARQPADATAPDSELRFELPGGAGALFTTRAHGNLSTLRGEQPEYGRRERDRLCEELGLRWLCASRQVHGTGVRRVRREDGSGGEALSLDADGHATALRGVGVMVLVADCLPVLLVSEGAVAALHAGWRGLAAGVLEEGVRAVGELGGGEIVALRGPVAMRSARRSTRRLAAPGASGRATSIFRHSLKSGSSAPASRGSSVSGPARSATHGCTHTGAKASVRDARRGSRG